MPTISFVAALALWAALLAGTARAGDHMPLIGCGAVPGDTTQTAFTVDIFNRNLPVVYATEIVPFAFGGYPSSPILGVECPAGFSAEPDSIPGAFIVLGDIATGNGPFVFRARTRQEPYELRYHFVGGSAPNLEWGLETCPSSSTPALSASWGSVKSLYR